MLALYKPLKLIWSARKFQQDEGPVQVEEEAGGDPAGGQDGDMKSLKVADITFALGSPYWLAYSHMLLNLHEVANRVSSWGSGCPCHGWLRTKASAGPGAENDWDIFLRGTLKDHSLPLHGDGADFACPMAGKRAPELASGSLTQILQTCADSKKPDVLINAADLEQQSRDNVVNDYQTGVDFILLTVTVKLGFWQDFPWNLCSLIFPGLNAAERQERARKLLEDFSKLPQDPSSHHRVTWRFLQPQSLLRDQLQKLATSHELRQLPELEYALKVLGFVPVVERVVEGQHSLVHRHAGYRQVTGAYVSCALRMPQIDQFMSQQAGKDQMAAMFQKIRKPKMLAKMFNFSQHPEWLEGLSKGKKGHSRLNRIGTAIMYMNDIALQFPKLDLARKKNKAQQRAEQKQRNKLLAETRPKEPLSERVIVQRLFAQHVAANLRPGEFYSMPVSVLQQANPAVSSLQSTMQFATGSASGTGEHDSRDVPAQVQDASVSFRTPDGEPRSDVFFKVLTTRAGFLKTVRRAPAGRCRLNKHDIALTFHGASEAPDEGGACVVRSEPLGCSEGGTAIHVLGSMGMDAAGLGSMLKWQAGHSECVMTLPAYNSQQDSQMLAQLVSQKAFEGQPMFLPEASVAAHAGAVLQDMEADGWVIRDPLRGWQLTRRALAKLSLSYWLENPQKFDHDSDTAPHPALDNLTSYQLCKKLQDQGWKWHRFSRHELHPYVRGGPRVWYSEGVTVARDYLLCLLQADSFLEEGQAVHHGQKAVYYRSLLQGRYDLAQGVLSIQDVGKPRLAQPALADDQASLHEPGLMPEDDLLWQSEPLLLASEPADKPRPAPADAKPRKPAKRKRPERDAASDLSSASVPSFADCWDKFYEASDGERSAQPDNALPGADVDLPDWEELFGPPTPAQRILWSLQLGLVWLTLIRRQVLCMRRGLGMPVQLSVCKRQRLQVHHL